MSSSARLARTLTFESQIEADHSGHLDWGRPFWSLGSQKMWLWYRGKCLWESGGLHTDIPVGWANCRLGFALGWMTLVDADATGAAGAAGQGDTSDSPAWCSGSAVAIARCDGWANNDASKETFDLALQQYCSSLKPKYTRAATLETLFSDLRCHCLITCCA